MGGCQPPEILGLEQGSQQTLMKQTMFCKRARASRSKEHAEEHARPRRPSTPGKRKWAECSQGQETAQDMQNNQLQRKGPVFAQVSS